ncbi:MAG: DVU3141 family protein [Bilophila sp.]
MHLLLMLCLGGCFGQSSPVVPPPAPPELSPVAQFMASNTPGATALIQDPAFGGEVRVTLEDSFLSAAGETCKRATLLSDQHEAEIVVICQNTAEPDAAWKLMPRVWGRGIPAP